jgi:hypothetical protein
MNPHESIFRLIYLEMDVYTRQGHSFFEPRAHRDVMRRNLGWFEQWLGIKYEGGTDRKSKYESIGKLSLKEGTSWAPFLRERGAI